MVLPVDRSDSSSKESTCLTNCSNASDQQTHRVHFSPVVSQLRYNQQQQHYPSVSILSSSYSSQPRNQRHPEQKAELCTSFFYNNQDNHYSAPYYYSQVDNHQNKNHFHHPDAFRINNVDSCTQKQVEKVKVQQSHRPRQEKVQRVVVTVPSANGSERLTMALGLSDEVDDVNYDLIYKVNSNPNPNQNEVHNIQYPDLLLSTPLQQRKTLQEVKAVVPWQCETLLGEMKKNNTESPRNNPNLLSTTAESESNGVVQDTESVNRKESASEKKSIKKKSNSKSGFVRRLSLFKKFVVGGRGGNRKTKNKEGKAATAVNGGANKNKNSSRSSSSSFALDGSCKISGEPESYPKECIVKQGTCEITDVYRDNCSMCDQKNHHLNVKDVKEKGVLLRKVAGTELDVVVDAAAGYHEDSHLHPHNVETETLCNTDYCKGRDFNHTDVNEQKCLDADDDENKNTRRNFPNTNVFVPTNYEDDNCWRERKEHAILSLPKPSPRLKQFLFRSKYRRPLEEIDDATDELSANVEKILEEIACLDNIMDTSLPQKVLREEVLREEAEFCAVSDISAGLSEISDESLQFCDSKKISREGLMKKPPLPPTSRYSVLRHQFFRNSGADTLTRPPAVPMKARHRLMSELDTKLSEFREELHRSREEIARSYPNFEEIENSVRSSMDIDRFGRNPQNSRLSTSWESSSSTYSSEEIPSATQHSRYAGKELLKEWNSIISEAKEKLTGPSKCFNNERKPSPKEFKGILETDLDTGTSREFFLENDTISDQNDSSRYPATVVKSPTKSEKSAVKLVQRSSCSMQDLTYEAPKPKMSTLNPSDPSTKEDRSRSMEFLLDDEKNAHLLPPENTLKKNQETRQASEHELRIQRSLQRLNVPDWYKNYATPGSSPAKPTPGREFGSGTGLAGGWSGLSSSKTSSLTSLQSAGRYSGSRTQFSSRHKSTGTASTGGRSSRESLMSPSSTASASPSPYYERSSFTYGMPYALTRFATARMSCGASPASLSPSPSPVGGITSSTSTPVSSGPMSRYGYNKTPYLGWRSQERLASKTLYRSPSERLAADLLAQKQKTAPPPSESEKQVSSGDISQVTSPRKENTSDLSLNTSDESNSNKLNRVRSSIKEVSNAIVDYVNETKPLDDGINGRASPRRGLIWLESSFVGTKPIDSPGTPDTPSVIMSSSRHLGSQASAYQHSKRSSLKYDGEQNGEKSRDSSANRSRNSETSQAFSSYLSRNEKMGERSNSSSVSSPTLEDVLDSLLGLRPPHKKIRSREKGHKSKRAEEPPEADGSTTSTSAAIPIAASGSHLYETPVSDWQERMNQPLDDSAYFPADTDNFMLTSTTTATGSNNNQDNRDKISYSSAFDEDNSNCANVNPPSKTTSKTQATILKPIEPPPPPPVKEEGENTGATRNTFNYGLPDERSCSERDYCAVDVTDNANYNYRFDDDDDVQGRIAQEESAFGTPTEIHSHTTIPSIINNPLAGLNESSNPPTPARHRRVSFDLDISDKDEKSSSRSRRDESIGGSIQCKNPKCAKTASGLEARREFKTCHNCNAYYCSRECRRVHWDRHKKVCMTNRVGTICKQIIVHVKEDIFVVNQLTTVAKRGYLAKGRGFVKLFFSSPERAERFLAGGLPELPEPWYIPHSDMLPEESDVQTYAELTENCRSYNPENRFVLYASVCVVNEVPTSGAVKWEREMISRSTKIKLAKTSDENQLRHHRVANPAHLNTNDPPPLPLPPTGAITSSSEGHSSSVPNTVYETLILRSVPTPASQQLNSIDDCRRRREVSFANIMRHLIVRGVDLRKTYPDIYSKLCNFVENDEPFIPTTIYFRDPESGCKYMCVIMPDSSDTSYEMSSDPSDKVVTIDISEQS